MLEVSKISTGKPKFVIDKEKIYDKTITAGFESVDDPTKKTTKNIDSSDRKVLKEKNVSERGNQLNADSAQGLQNKLQVKNTDKATIQNQLQRKN